MGDNGIKWADACMDVRRNLYMATEFLFYIMHGVVQVILGDEGKCASRGVGNVL